MREYIKFLKIYVSEYASDIFASIVLALIYTMASMSSAILSKYLIDMVIANNSRNLLKNLLLVIVGVLVISTLIYISYNSIIIRVFNKIGYNLKCSIFRHLTYQDISAIKDLNTGTINYRMMGDAEVLKNSLSQFLFSIITNFSLLIFISIYMFWINWEMALFAIILLSTQAIVIMRFRKPVYDCAWERKITNESLASRMIELFNSFHLIKACRNEEKEIESFNKSMNHITEVSNKEALLSISATCFAGVINSLVTFGVLWAGGIEVINGRLTLGSLMAFVMVSNLLSSPISALAGAVVGFQDIRASSKRIFDILGLKSEIMNAVDSVKPEVKGNITFTDVTFGYSASSTILKGISFEAKSHSIISIVGRSGIGKSTICSLMARFYEPHSGNIYVDGYDLKKIDLEYYRSNIGMVLQNSFVISGTIRENILLGWPNASEEDIIKAAKEVNAHEFISNLPDGYWTQVGEKGVFLSCGEAQRIALARIFLQNPRIVILDEATSFVDIESEEFIQNAIKRIAEKSTVFIVTHKLSTAKLASKIIVLDEGKVVEQGSHEELISIDGLYKKMYRKVLA